MEESLDIQKYKHTVNCLIDPDRNIRKTALEKLNKELLQLEKKEDVFILLREYMINPLLKCLEDKIEKNRELTIKLLKKLVESLDLDEKVYILVLNAIISRLNHNPFPETSEELRQELILILHKLLTKSEKDFLPVISDLCSMISKLLNDPCPEVKIKLSEFIIILCEKLNKAIGPHCKGMIISLAANLKHSHNKIRKVTIMALGEVLLCENAGKFFEDCHLILKTLANDKNYDVRKAFYSIVYRIITNFNIMFLRKYEHLLVIFLMNGLSDEKEDIVKLCITYLDDAGEYRKKLAVELGEDEDSDNMTIDN